MRCANLFLAALFMLIVSVALPRGLALAQDAGTSAGNAASPSDAEPGSYRLDYVPLNNYNLEKWGDRKYNMYGFPRKISESKGVLIGTRERKWIGGISLETIVKENEVIFIDSWGDPAQENGWFDLRFTCKRDNLLTMQKMEYSQGGSTNVCDVTDGTYELEHFKLRRSGPWPEGTVTEASLLRIFTMLPRVKGVSYAIDHYTVTPELSPFSTKGDAIVCDGPETLKIDRMNMECTKYSYRDMQAWVRNVDDTLVRFLVPGRREIVIAEKPHQFAKVIQEAAEEE